VGKSGPAPSLWGSRPPTKYKVPLAHPSPHPKRCLLVLPFLWGHGCVQQADTQTDHTTTVARGRGSVHAIWPGNNANVNTNVKTTSKILPSHAGSGPHPTRGSFNPPKSPYTPHVDQASRFCTAAHKLCLYFIMGWTCPQNCPFP